MYSPQGMKFTAEEAASGGNKPVLKLMKNLYGLKQAGRLWHQMLSDKLRELDYKQSSVDLCLNYKIVKAIWNAWQLHYEPAYNDFEFDRSIWFKNAKPVGTPIANVVLSTEDINLSSNQDASLFRTLAGALLWFTRCTRPDIGFAVHQMTRRTHAPRICDFKLGKRILRHLAGPVEHCLDVSNINAGTTIHFEAYTDADWALVSSQTYNA